MEDFEWDGTSEVAEAVSVTMPVDITIIITK